MITLQKIHVDFNEEEHTYTNTDTGAMLSGITSTLVKRVFPDKYGEVPEAVLARAAEHGTQVHKDIELAEAIGVQPSTPEGISYFKLKEQLGLKNLDNEYTVSDMEHYATNIDVVYEVSDNLVDLGDFKTSYKFDAESTAWQLSVCAYFFELNNPGIKVRNIFGIWLRGEIAQKIDLERHSESEVQRLISADMNDEEFVYEKKLPDYILQNEATLVSLKKQIDALTAQYDAVKANVLEQMILHKDKSIDTGIVKITYVAPALKARFDMERFRKEHEKLCGSYMTTSATKGQLKLIFR